MQEDNLKDLYQWFDSNRSKIIENHLNDYVLIANNAIIGYYSLLPDALVAASV